jgi:hypothetical protein
VPSEIARDADVADAVLGREARGLGGGDVLRQEVFDRRAPSQGRRVRRIAASSAGTAAGVWTVEACWPQPAMTASASEMSSIRIGRRMVVPLITYG